MGNSLRCCLACVLPCGALDLIRIVHLNGYVEEITRSITAGEILQANPNHVLSKPCSQGVVRKILILSPESELKRGSIYFLIPDSSLPEKKRRRKDVHRRKKTLNNNSNADAGDVKDDDQCVKLCEKYLEEDVSSTPIDKEHRHRRRHSRSASVSTWRPHLDSISEDLN
uniref:6,7-dimethyl-8-ribityllumazine synthase n=3 Tax=Noccaea caerulescens TaxID=107243 RepID=A0A1J3HPJ6_NOCCA